MAWASFSLCTRTVRLASLSSSDALRLHTDLSTISVLKCRLPGEDDSLYPLLSFVIEFDLTRRGCDTKKSSDWNSRLLPLYELLRKKLTFYKKNNWKSYHLYIPIWLFLLCMSLISWMLNKFELCISEVIERELDWVTGCQSLISEVIEKELDWVMTVRA